PIPSNAELEILRILWRRGPSTVRDVHDELKGERGGGHTPVHKIMQKRAEQKLVTRDESERSHVYKPAVEEKSVKRRLVSELLDKAFDGFAVQALITALYTKAPSS